MRQFVIDQLSGKERQAVRLHLEKYAEAGPIEDMFWLKLDPETLTETQRSHRDCGPFYVAIELGEEQCQPRISGPQSIDPALPVHRLRQPPATRLSPRLYG